MGSLIQKRRSEPPASSSSTRREPLVISRLAITQPAVPAPTMMWSNDSTVVLDRPVRHLEVQRRVGVGMLRDDRLVQFHPESRARGRNHVAVFPSNRHFKNIRVKAAPAL